MPEILIALPLVLLLLSTLTPVLGILPECDFMLELNKKQDECGYALHQEDTLHLQHSSPLGCRGMWDNLSCWMSVEHTAVATVRCPSFIVIFQNKDGVVHRNCTDGHWSEPYPPYEIACGFNDSEPMSEQKEDYYNTIKMTYTVGYATSLASLTIAMLILSFSRKLHCTRNYIHMHLFMSFILRAISVFVKDAVLFSDDEIDPCIPDIQLDEEEGYFRRMEKMKVLCKLVMIFFQYCIMANFSWLLVEGLYLHTLLVISFFSERKYFWWYILIGWAIPAKERLSAIKPPPIEYGAPAIFTIPWALSRWAYENTGCWNTNNIPEIWWIIKGPILFCILVNLIMFISIIRILVKKLKCPDVGGNDCSHYKRLVKSTLLLIPLFGIHYILFAFTPDMVPFFLSLEIRLYFELSLGSFQGFVVAILYCFLNGEVQAELKRKWRRWCVDRYLAVDVKQQHNSTMSNGGANGGTQVSLLTKCSPKTRSSSLQVDSSLI